MKLHFRMTLMLTLLGLITLTVATIGVCSYFTARSTAQELCAQILEQTSLRVDQQVEKLVNEAVTQCAMTRQFVASGKLSGRDFPQLVGFWRQSVAISPDITSHFMCLEETGDTVGLSRLQAGRSSVWQTTWNAQKPQFELREFWLDDYPKTPYKFDPAAPGPDIRLRPWYVAAKEARRPVWTDTYLFLGLGAAKKVVGVTYSVPCYSNASIEEKNDPAAKLNGVIAADFDLNSLSQFLQGLHVGQTGFSFLVEFRADGTRRVIAHPRPELLVDTSGPSVEIVPIEKLGDPRIRAFMGQVPAKLSLSEIGASESMRFTVDGDVYLGRYTRLHSATMPRWMICTVLPEDDILGVAHASARLVIWITLGALLLASLAGFYISLHVARPLETLARDAAEIGHLRLDERPPMRSFVVEVDRLALVSEEMKAGLRSFQKYLPAELVRGLIDSGREAALGGERRELSVYFSDIRDFTMHAESMPSEKLVAHLGDYLGAMNEQILALDGTVDKYIGDSVMAFWNAPKPNANHAAAACRAALQCQRRLGELRLDWNAAGKPGFYTRIGIHTGEAIVGNIGSAARMNYTVIGDTVNLASRLEGLNKIYGIGILISEDTQRAAGTEFFARPIDWVAVKGRHQGVQIFELVGLSSEIDSATRELAECYALALACYRARQWTDALRNLDEALKIRADDGPTQTLIARCKQYLTDPPEEGWDGIYRLTVK